MILTKKTKMFWHKIPWSRYQQ